MKHELHLLAFAALITATPLRADDLSTAAAATVPAADPAIAEVVAVAEQFGVALKAGDTANLTKLLDEDVLILESGGAERSRAEYLGHHAIADAKFLRDARVETLRRAGDVSGDLAWVATESEIHSGAGADAKHLSSTESLVLARDAGQWRIVHVHWSSRPKKESKQ